MNASISDTSLPCTESASTRFLVCGEARPLIATDERCAFSSDAEAPFDAVIVTKKSAALELPALLRRRRAWLAPVADLSGHGLWFADICCTDGSRLELRRAIERLSEILAVLRALPGIVTAADDDETLLLARIHSRNARLQPVYDATMPQLVRYPLAGPLQEPERAAERLADHGWLARSFFDRMHACPACGSSRLNVREECPACRSAELNAEAIVHHFRCAHQAIERNFVQGDNLVCPKCRRRLRHFGVDYDRPGSVTICGACGHVDADADVAFVCIDCGTNTDAGAVPTRDWYSYAITTVGEQQLLGGDLRSLRSNIAEAATFHALADHWLRIQQRYGRPSAVLRLVFTRATEVQAEAGARTLATARRQAIEVVRGELRETDFMIETPEGLLIVMPETDDRTVKVPHQRILQRLEAMLAIDLGIQLRCIEPAELLATQNIQR